MDANPSSEIATYNLGAALYKQQKWNDSRNEYKKINEWGYNPIYAYQAFLNIDRSYPEYFEKQGFDILENINLQEEVKKKGCGDNFKEEKAKELIKSLKKKK